MMKLLRELLMLESSAEDSRLQAEQASKKPLREVLRGSKGNWKLKKITFDQLKRLTTSTKGEGIVLLGAGGNANEWVDGVTEVLHDEGISATPVPSQIFAGLYELTTTGGRTDIVLFFKKGSSTDFGKMASWRLRFGDCSWISDYLVNYEKHHR